MPLPQATTGTGDRPRRRTAGAGRVTAGGAGARWAGARWAGARWAGARWAGARWAGARWAGARWAAAGQRVRRVDPIGAAVVVATAAFALAGIGSPLLGLSVLADTASLIDYSGYRDVLAGTAVQHNYHRDLVDSAMPNSILFGEALRSGEFAAWNPYALGGAPLGGTPNLAIASPVSLPWWVLPGWLAPAYVKLLEIVCAVGGSYLFLRRVSLGHAAAWLGGLVFATSAFMVAWTGWPQTRVACLIPALFWAVERLAQRTRATDVALVSLPVAGMLLGGFPAVTAYALLTAGAYLAVRVAAEHRRQWRPIIGRLAAAAAGVAAGVGLAAWQLVPWVRYMSTVYVTGRTQTPGDHIPVEALLTAIAPYAFGTTNPGRPPDWFGPLELVDAESYVGAAAAVLIVAAVALAGTARRLLPRGIWFFVVSAAALWLAAAYSGGPLLWLLQQTSFLFSDNFIGRARSVLGFLLAILAAVGFETLLRRREARADVPAAARRYGWAVWLTAGAFGVLLYLGGRAVAARATAEREPRTPGPEYLAHLNGQVMVGVALVAVAGGCAAWLWFARDPSAGWRRRVRTVAAATLPVLIAAQALWWVQSYYPRTDRDTFYPPTPTQEFLASRLGHERYFGADGAIFGSVDVMARLRGYHGHGFIERGYAELADMLPGEQFRPPTTAITASPERAAMVAVHPVLDRAAVRYYVAPPEVRPFGTLLTQPTDGTAVDLIPGQTVTVPMPVSGPLRGIGVTPVRAPGGTATATPAPWGPVRTPSTPVPASSPQSSAHVRVVLRDAAGRVVATGERIGRDDTLHSGHLQPGYIADGLLEGGSPWHVPIAAEDVAPDAVLTAEITALGTTPLRVAGRDGRPALSVVAGADDGLRLHYARESVIYERTRALSRARWASHVRVEPDAQRRLDLLAGGSLAPDEVVLDRAGSPADGKSARVTWLEDGLDTMAISVQAEGAGYLVLADAIQHGWHATVDGEPASIEPADHGFVAVAVPAGSHTVRFAYPGPSRGPGAWLTGLTILALVAACGWQVIRERRRAA